jgi:hypothetical protein
MLKTLIFDVPNIEFRCCRHVMLGVVSRGGRRRGPGVGCANINFHVADLSFDVADM